MNAAIPEWLDSAGSFVSALVTGTAGNQAWYLNALWYVLLAVLLAPILLFLTRGWVHRRDDILSSISPRAAAMYLANFQSADHHSRALFEAIAAIEDFPANEDRLNDARTQLQALQSAHADAGQIRVLEREIRRLEGMIQATMSASRGNDLKTALDKAARAFHDYYIERFGRRRYVWPTLLLIFLTGLLLSYPLAVAARSSHAPGAAVVAGSIAAPSTGWEWVIGFAILGGYVRVVYELCLRYYQDNVRPADLLWGCYRLIVSVPLGYAVAILLEGGANARAAFAAAFLLGLFPTSTVTTLGRRLFAKWTGLPDADTDNPEQLRQIPAIDPSTTLLLTEEGITTFTHLAYADPIRLSIRTGLCYSYVVSFVSEGLLAVYLTTRERMEAARRFGLAGGYEAASLWREANDPTDAEAQARARQIIKDLSDRLGTTEDGLKNTLAEIAADPYLQFIRECWASNVTW